MIFSHARLRLGALLIVLAVLAPLPAAVSAAESAAPAETKAVEFPVGPYLLADAETGEVFEHSDAMRPWFPASTTKLMTIYVAFRAVLAGELNFDSAVLYSENAAAQPASKMGFKPGTTLTLDNAIKMMMVKSANDVAVAVAEAVGGSVEGFSARMNAEAARLGMTRSHFVNPHGLPDERQVTTARDMALLTRALLIEFPQHRDYYKLHAIRLGKVVMKNYNTLIERYPGANGMKTGFICASGYNLVASARRGEREIIAVVFGEYGGRARAEHAAKLLDEGFAMTGSTSPETVTTLANVSSGTNYTAPLDMRPFVCAANRAAAASEANSEGGEEEDVSHLSAPIYHGPPIRVTVGVPAANAETITTAAAARLPRPRPTMPGDPPGLDANAFAPEGGPSAPIDAIDSATGAAAPLSDAPAN